ncbi:helix-turn-helix domain-containing protein [Mucilaginibacter sp. BJC16-A38]|uniref:helix-turn-helix domain-containing protein n=1 Tax=Mucilaginibacter phenanthrenivorans TaxID=1234842 RepID=UPI0021570D39|nr:helix-turn-helix domain-containing protein [Mucilaginibacter phenanthrenivorans]MCR8556550.1 helix-turn-helix domain-containing protein [Mucilaginibacter phenanthrenivorans]
MPATALALYRRKKGLTQEQLSELSGVTSRTIQRIEKGAVVPHVQTLKILAACLDIEAEVLMDEPEGSAPATAAKPATLSPLFHVAALLGLGMPILNIILPFILWLFKRDADQAYDRQGRQVLNFHLTMSILFFPSIVLMVYFFPLGFPLTMLVYLFMVVMTLVNLFRAINLKKINYPLSWRFLKL